MERRRVKVLVGLSVAIFLLAFGYFSLEDAVIPTLSPGDVDSRRVGESLQVAGQVRNFSREGSTVNFVLVGDGGSVPVTYAGEMPPTFDTRGEVLVTGTLDEGGITASKLVTKCPSRYGDD